VRDVLVCGPRIDGVHELSAVPAGSRIGTGSLRRTAQLRASFPNVEPTPIRGNVDTRLAKAAGADYEGAILAAAGVQRMGAADRVAAYLPIEQMVPAVGQGAIGVEVRTDDGRALRLCELLNDARTFACVEAERRILESLEGGCQVPLGAHFRYEDDALLCDAVVLSLDGKRAARVSRRDAADAAPLAVADAVVAALRAQGADDILAEIRGDQGGAV
jgi:hydroxymethylbilane synthase